jgi:hypothetical protein
MKKRGEPLSVHDSRPFERSLTMRRVVAFGLFLLSAAPAAAQGPWIVSAPANPKHEVVEHGGAAVARYALIPTLQGSPTAGAEIDLAKPALVASCVINGATVANCIQKDVHADVLKLPAGTYTAVIVAISSAGVREVSGASAPFTFSVPVPGQQGAPGLSRSPTGS